MKFPYTFDSSAKQSLRRRNELARAKAVSLLYEGSGIPILQPLALRILEITNGYNIREKDFDWWYRNYMLPDVIPSKFNHLVEPITDEMRTFIAERFNISIADQVSIENQILTASLDDYLTF